MPHTNLFLHRADPAQLPELMDGPCTYEDFRACLRDLAQVNIVTLAHRPTLAFLSQFTSTHEPLHILDIGCGGGDMLRHIARWAARRKLNVQLTGIDLNPHATRAAAEFSRDYPQIRYITGDVYSVTEPFDLALSSLLTHHLSDVQIVALIDWMESHARRGWFVNDLYRSQQSHRLFALLAELAGWHRFVQHDGPVSIRRSFREPDWQHLCTAAGLDLASIHIAKAFPSRLCVGRVR